MPVMTDEESPPHSAVAAFRDTSDRVSGSGHLAFIGY